MQKFNLHTESPTARRPLFTSFGEELLVLGLLLRFLFRLELLSAVLLEFVDVVHTVRDGCSTHDNKGADDSTVYHGNRATGKEIVATNTARQQLVVQEIEYSLRKIPALLGQRVQLVSLQTAKGDVRQNLPVLAKRDRRSSVILAMTRVIDFHVVLLLPQARIGENLVVHGEHEANRRKLLRDGNAAVIQREHHRVQNSGEQVPVKEEKYNAQRISTRRYTQPASTQQCCCAGRGSA